VQEFLDKPSEQARVQGVQELQTLVLQKSATETKLEINNNTIYEKDIHDFFLADGHHFIVSSGTSSPRPC
jgi:hypothetical protein